MLFAVFFISSIAVDAQKDEEKRDSSEANRPTAFEPSPSHPFGKLNPNAPEETAQFSFMIGAFSCDDKERQLDGTWIESKTIWNSGYFVNGGGIQDRYWSKTVVASGTRIYDKTKEKMAKHSLISVKAGIAGKPKM